MQAIKQAWGSIWCAVSQPAHHTGTTATFAASFGELGNRKKPPEGLRNRAEGILQDNEKVLLVTNITVDGQPVGAFGEGEFWFHIDSGYSAQPYKYTFLYALELPAKGGNTLFSNMYEAYEAVPDKLKERLRGKRALHIHEYNRAKQASHAGDIGGIPHAHHPVFITHPETGRKSLFVDRLMTTRIEGVSDAESEAILNTLYDIGERREQIYEHVWQRGDFLMWDNRCTIHARTDFPKDERRLLRRCTVEGPLCEWDGGYASQKVRSCGPFWPPRLKPPSLSIRSEPNIPAKTKPFVEPLGGPYEAVSSALSRHCHGRPVRRPVAGAIEGHDYRGSGNPDHVCAEFPEGPGG